MIVRAAIREVDPDMFVMARVLVSWIKQVTNYSGASFRRL